MVAAALSNDNYFALVASFSLISLRDLMISLVWSRCIYALNLQLIKTKSDPVASAILRFRHSCYDKVCFSFSSMIFYVHIALTAYLRISLSSCCSSSFSSPCLRRYVTGPYAAIPAAILVVISSTSGCASLPLSSLASHELER